MVHLVGGILCCGLVAIRPLTPFRPELLTFLAIMLSQAYLLGLWTAFSDAALWSRLFVLVIGAVYLEGLLALVASHEGVQWAAATTSLASAGVLLAARRWGRELRRITESASRVAFESYQFKIQGLMILTFVLALLFAGAKGLRETVSSNLTLMVVFSLYNVVLGLAATWAALGLGRPIKRWPAVFLLPPAFGTLFWYGMRSPRLEAYWNLNVCLLMQTAVTFGSLLVLRSCGFRLILRDPTDLESSSKPTVARD